MPKTSRPRSRKSPSRRRGGDDLTIHRAFLARAESVATQPAGRGGSPHPSVKVGAVLVDRHGHKIAAAANRFAYGVDRRRPERYRAGHKSLWINCAEQIVIAQALRKHADIKDARLYITLEPCAVCAGLIGELRIKEVFVPVGALRRYARLKAKWKDSIEIGLTKLAEAGVRLIAIDTRTAKKRAKKKD
jgi:tRNA(Arg) A34 adenosine deaminase TadA